MANYNNLDAHQAEIVRMYVEEGLKPWQIAERVGVQAPAIRVRLKKAGVFVGLAKGGQKGPRQRPKMNTASKVTIPAEVEQAPRIDREPCRRCGVRADIGCRHLGQAPLGFCIP